MKYDSRIISHALNKLKKDKSFIHEAINLDILLFQIDTTSKTKFSWMKQIKYDKKSVKQIYNEKIDQVKNDKEYLLKTIETNIDVKSVLECISDSLKNDWEFVLQIVKRNSSAFKFLSKFHQDKSITLESAKTYREIFYDAPELLKDRSFVLT